MAAEPIHGGRDLGQIGDPDRELVGGVQAVRERDVVEQVEERASLGLGAGGDLAEEEERRDAVLVPDVLGVHAVAQRLLVAEGQALDPADPLEPGQGLGVRLPGGGRHLAEQRGGDDRRRVGALLAGGEQVRGEQRADLVPPQHPPAVRAGDRGGAAVGVGVVRDHEVRALLLGEGHREVHRAGFLGVRERDGGEVGVGLLLLGHHARRGEPGGLEDLDDRGAPDAVQGRVDDVEVTGTVVGELRDRVEVAVDDVLGEDLPRVSPRHVGECAHRGDPLGDAGVGRRHDLAAVSQVDLVAVVLGRVVAGGHHHSRDAAELADRVGQQRRGQRPGQHVGREPGTGHHLGGVAGEDVGVVAGVVPDHDGALTGSAVVPQVRREAGGGAQHHDPVHPVGPGAQGAPQTGGAELQRAVEPVREVGGVGARLDPGDDLLELGAGLLVGVLGGPGAGAVEQDVVVRSGHGRHASAPVRGSRHHGGRDYPSAGEPGLLLPWHLDGRRSGRGGARGARRPGPVPRVVAAGARSGEGRRRRRPGAVPLDAALHPRPGAARRAPRAAAAGDGDLRRPPRVGPVAAHVDRGRHPDGLRAGRGRARPAAGPGVLPRRSGAEVEPRPDDGRLPGRAPGPARARLLAHAELVALGVEHDHEVVVLVLHEAVVGAAVAHGRAPLDQLGDLGLDDLAPALDRQAPVAARGVDVEVEAVLPGLLLRHDLEPDLRSRSGRVLDAVHAVAGGVELAGRDADREVPLVPGGVPLRRRLHLVAQHRGPELDQPAGVVGVDRQLPGHHAPTLVAPSRPWRRPACSRRCCRPRRCRGGSPGRGGARAPPRSRRPPPPRGGSCERPGSGRSSRHCPPAPRRRSAPRTPRRSAASRRCCRPRRSRGGSPGRAGAPARPRSPRPPTAGASPEGLARVAGARGLVLVLACVAHRDLPGLCGLVWSRPPCHGPTPPAVHPKGWVGQGFTRWG